MNSEPSYLPLLRRVANAECNAAQYLSAWAQATPREDVRCVIGTIALWVLYQAISRHLLLETSWPLWTNALIGAVLPPVAPILHHREL